MVFFRTPFPNFRIIFVKLLTKSDFGVQYKKTRGACGQAERKFEISTLKPDLDNANVGNLYGLLRHTFCVPLF